LRRLEEGLQEDTTRRGLEAELELSEMVYDSLGYRGERKEATKDRGKKRSGEFLHATVWEISKERRDKNGDEQRTGRREKKSNLWLRTRRRRKAQ